MKQKSDAKQPGLRMAFKIAAISVGVTGVGLAMSAEALAENSEGQTIDGEGEENGSAASVSGEPEQMKISGYSCWGVPVSRGPLAPPPQSDDFEALLEAVPT